MESRALSEATTITVNLCLNFFSSKDVCLKQFDNNFQLSSNISTPPPSTKIPSISPDCDCACQT